MSPSTILTPVSKTAKKKLPCSLSDYNEQSERSANGQQIMWDDAKGNPTRHPGGLFGFVHNKSHVELHFITEIHPINARLDSWSRNVGQGDRNVLYLSPRVISIPWSVWCNELQITTGHEQGTRRVANNDKNNSIYNHVNHDYDVETGEIFVR